MEASAPEFANGFSMIKVVGGNFCVPYPNELIIKKKYHGFFLNQRYQVLDGNGNLLLQVDGSSLSLQKKRVMHDAAGSPILTMREKIKLLTLRHRWVVHRGKSRDQKDLIFGVQRSHPLEMKARLEVFMGSNINEDNSDFQLVGTNSDQSCKVYKGDNLVAEVTEGLPNSNWSLRKWKESFRVKINAGMDYAFIVALLVMVTVNDYI